MGDPARRDLVTHRNAVDGTHCFARQPSARIIMFSMNDDPVFAARAIEVGAKGYVSKSGDPNDLVEAIRQVGRGDTYLPPAIARSIAFAGPAAAQGPLAKLTSREMEIVRLLSAGKTLSEIAWLVHSSYKTVANTSSIIRQKLGVRTSGELVRLAIAWRCLIETTSRPDTVVKQDAKNDAHDRFPEPIPWRHAGCLPAWQPRNQHGHDVLGVCAAA